MLIYKILPTRFGSVNSLALNLLLQQCRLGSIYNEPTNTFPFPYFILCLSTLAMSRGTDRLIKSAKQFADLQYKLFTARYGQQLIDIFEFPIKLVLSPFTLAFDIVGSAPRGFGVPELISKLSYASIFVYILELYQSFIILCHLCHVHCVGFCKVRDFIGCFSFNFVIFH